MIGPDALMIVMGLPPTGIELAEVPSMVAPARVIEPVTLSRSVDEVLARSTWKTLDEFSVMVDVVSVPTRFPAGAGNGRGRGQAGGGDDGAGEAEEAVDVAEGDRASGHRQGVDDESRRGCARGDVSADDGERADGFIEAVEIEEAVGADGDADA